MSNQMHNLAGWLRDLAAAQQQYEHDPGGLGTQLWLKFVEYVDEARWCAEDVESSDDDPDDAPDDGAPDVGGDDASLREDDAPRAGRPAARSEAHRAAPSGLGRELADVPGTVRSAPEPDVQDVRAGAVGAPCGVSRREVHRTAPPEYRAPEARSVPRGTPAPAKPARKKKGVKRATTRKKR